MAEKWYTVEKITSENLFQGLKQVEQIEWVYAERAEETVLMRAADFFALAVPSQVWHHGRAFSPQIEIAWWQNRHGWQARMILTDSQQVPALDVLPWQATTALALAPAKERLLLLGERDPNVVTEPPAWRTARVPHLLTYPAQAGWGRVALLVQPYQDAGMLATQRFLELQEGG